MESESVRVDGKVENEGEKVENRADSPVEQPTDTVTAVADETDSDDGDLEDVTGLKIQSENKSEDEKTGEQADVVRSDSPVDAASGLDHGKGHTAESATYDSCGDDGIEARYDVMDKTQEPTDINKAVDGRWTVEEQSLCLHFAFLITSQSRRALVFLLFNDDSFCHDKCVVMVHK